MQTVREVVDVVWPEEREPVQHLQTVIPFLSSEVDVFVQQLPRPDQREGTGCELWRPSDGMHSLVGAHHSRTRGLFGGGAHDRRDDQDWRVGMTVADRVKEAVERGDEGAFAHRIGIDDVDA